MLFFLERAEEHGFTSIRERQGELELLFFLGLALNQPMEAPMISNGLLDVDVAPFLGGRVLRILDHETGASITGYNITRNLFFPFCGGEETRIGGIYDLAGMFFQFGVSERSENAITLVSDTGSLLITRRIALDKEAPILRIQVEVQNLGDAPRQTIVRSHTNFDLGSLQSVTAQFTNRNGDSVTRTAPPIIAGLREGEYYRDVNAPKNEWRLSGDKGYEIVQRFDDDTLDFAWLYAYPDYLNDLEAEIWRKPVILQPNESTTFEYEMEVVKK